MQYRSFVKSTDGIYSYEVFYKETKLFIRSPKNFSTKVLRTVSSIREPLEKYIQHHPEFLTSLKPIQVQSKAALIVKKMCEVSQRVGTGPMSAVAGTIAEFLGREMLKWIQKENLRQFLIIENGGDIFAYVDTEVKVGIYAGKNSPFTGRLAIKINLPYQPIGICTSSGTVGHSLSFGKADAVVIVSPSASFSDALATQVGNLVKTEKDIKEAVEFAKNFEETLFVCIIKNKTISFFSRTDKIEVERLVSHSPLHS